jgi:hypothetical protein
MRNALLVAGLLLSVPVRGAHAQSSIARSDVQLRAAAALRGMSESRQTGEIPGSGYAEASARDYRWEGLAIGAAVLGVAGALILHSTCEADEACTGPTVGGFLLGVVVGGVAGGLVGGLIPKGAP